jgi:GAF domain-containing protein
VIPDVSVQPVASSLAVTESIGIGAYVGAPIRRADGTPAGMLCCISRSPQPDLDQGSLRMLELLAQVVAEDRGALRERARRSREDLERIQRVLTTPPRSVRCSNPSSTCAAACWTGTRP